MSENGKLQGKRALVTGSGTGLGKEIALEFAREGADVVLHYSKSSKGALEAVEAIKAMGHKAVAYQADLSNVDACFSLVDQAIEFLGGIDILMNNAGITLSGPFLDATPEQFDLLFNVNVRAEFFCAQRAAKTMVKQDNKGVIINMCSVHGFGGVLLHSIYDGTKGAIRGMTNEMAVELAPLGIRVNGIAPGWIAVESHYLQVPNFDPGNLGWLIPCGRLGVPSEISKACVFLACDDSKYMYGTMMLVDGGLTAKLAFDIDKLDINFGDVAAN